MTDQANLKLNISHGLRQPPPVHLTLGVTLGVLLGLHSDGQPHPPLLTTLVTVSTCLILLSLYRLYQSRPWLRQHPVLTLGLYFFHTLLDTLFACAVLVLCICLNLAMLPDDSLTPASSTPANLTAPP